MIIPMKLITETFLIPFEDKYIFFAPKRNSFLALVNKEFAGIIQDFDRHKRSKDKSVRDAISLLKSKKIIGYVKDKPLKPKIPKKVEPDMLTIMPTLDCNFRCVYCYARGGDKKRHIDMGLAKKSFDMLLDSCRKKGVKKTELMFHGGGEPFLESNWDFIEQFIGYAERQSKEKGIEVSMNGITNGYLSKKQIDFIVKHFEHLTISMDGPKEFQDSTRFYLDEAGNLKGSFEKVMATIKEFDRQGFGYGFRVTLSAKAAEKFSDVVDFFMNDTKSTGINVEPIYNWGRQTSTKIQGPELEDFAKQFVEQKFRAAKRRFSLTCGLLSFNRMKTTWCGACGRTMCVTPENIVTSCIEVCNKDDPRADTYVYGKYDLVKGKFDFDMKKLQNLAKRHVSNLPGCNGCFAKYFCAGGCPAKMNGNIFDIETSQTCVMNKKIIEHYLKRLVMEKDPEVIDFLRAKQVNSC